jgi:hypothetical protein
LSEKSDSTVRDQDESAEAPRKRGAYEPPALTVLGTVAELTRQELKVSGGADLVGFQPSYS